jgi:hypothetical protein
MEFVKDSRPSGCRRIIWKASSCMSHNSTRPRRPHEPGVNTGYFPSHLTQTPYASSRSRRRSPMVGWRTLSPSFVVPSQGHAKSSTTRLFQRQAPGLESELSSKATGMPCDFSLDGNQLNEILDELKQSDSALSSSRTLGSTKFN